MNEATIPQSHLLKKFVSHVHLSEPNLAPLTENRIHFETVLALLRDEYQGWISLEMKASGLDRLEESLERIVNWVRVD